MVCMVFHLFCGVCCSHFWWLLWDTPFLMTKCPLISFLSGTIGWGRPQNHFKTGELALSTNICLTRKVFFQEMFTFLRSLHALHNTCPISVYVCTEDVIHKSFQILPPSLSSKLLETFSSNFWKRGKVVGSMKVCELASEVSWLPLTCIQKGVVYEGFSHNPAHTAKIQTDLLQSKRCMYLNWKLFQTCTGNVLLQCNAGLESQRIAGRLEHLGVEANPVLVTAPKPVSMLLAQHTYLYAQAFVTCCSHFLVVTGPQSARKRLKSSWKQSSAPVTWTFMQLLELKVAFLAPKLQTYVPCCEYTSLCGRYTF